MPGSRGSARTPCIPLPHSTCRPLLLLPPLGSHLASSTRDCHSWIRGASYFLFSISHGPPGPPQGFSQVEKASEEAFIDLTAPRGRKALQLEIKLVFNTKSDKKTLTSNPTFLRFAFFMALFFKTSSLATENVPTCRYTH